MIGHRKRIEELERKVDEVSARLHAVRNLARHVSEELDDERRKRRRLTLVVKHLLGREEP